jgi:hypothetical protein
MLVEMIHTNVCGMVSTVDPLYSAGTFPFQDAPITPDNSKYRKKSCPKMNITKLMANSYS